MSVGPHDHRPAMLVEILPAALLGLAVGFGVLAVAGWPTAAAASALIGAEIALRFLARVAVPPRFELPAFAPRDLESSDELLLTLDQRLPVAATPALDELLLEDRLPPTPPDSRVVRLFDVAHLTDPGELRQRVERHLRPTAERGESPVSDDSAALHEALAELKRSLS